MKKIFFILLLLFSLQSFGQNIFMGVNVNVDSLKIGLAGTRSGVLQLRGTTSGTATIKVADAAGTGVFMIPTTTGTSGYFLTSSGSANSAMTWTDPSPFTPSDVAFASAWNGVTTIAPSKNTIYDIRPYKSYIAIVDQSGTSAPTATILQSELSGTPTWARSGAGVYTVTLTGEWTAAKTWVMLTNGDGFPVGSNTSWFWTKTSTDVLTLARRDNAGAGADGYTQMSIEIRVYF